MTFKKSFLLLILTSLSFIINGQTLTGIVLDKNNVPLIGVNVFNDSGKGVITDINGSFTLTLEQGMQKLISATLDLKPISAILFRSKRTN